MNDFVLECAAEVVLVVKNMKRHNSGMIDNFILSNPIKCRYDFSIPVS